LRRRQFFTFAKLYVIVSILINAPGTTMSFSILSVRLSDQERVLLEAASAQARTSLSDFRPAQGA